MINEDMFYSMFFSQLLYCMLKQSLCDITVMDT